MSMKLFQSMRDAISCDLKSRSDGKPTTLVFGERIAVAGRPMLVTSNGFQLMNYVEPEPMRGTSDPERIMRIQVSYGKRFAVKK